MKYAAVATIALVFVALFAMQINHDYQQRLLAEGSCAAALAQMKQEALGKVPFEFKNEVWNECPKTAHCFPPGVKGPYQK